MARKIGKGEATVVGVLIGSTLCQICESAYVQHLHREKITCDTCLDAIKKAIKKGQVKQEILTLHIPQRWILTLHIPPGVEPTGFDEIPILARLPSGVSSK